MNALDRRALRTLPLERTVVESYYDCESLTTEQLRALCASHERLRKELSGAEIVARERLVGVLDEIDRTLRVPAAEYVPAFGDVFAIIDRTKAEG